MRILIAIIITLTFAISSSAQSPTYSVEVDRVEISEKVKEKTFHLGLHRVFSIGTKSLSLHNMFEVAFHIKTKDRKRYLIDKAFIKLALDEYVSRDIPIVIRLRKVDRKGHPSKIIYEDTLNLWDHFHKKKLSLDLRAQNIRIKRRGLFLSIGAVHEKDKKIIGVEMTSRESEARTFCASVFNEDKKWLKHTFSSGKKPWNAKARLQLISYK